MNFSHGYGAPTTTAEAQAVVHQALDAGVTLFDTAALYGFGANESLVGPMLRPHRQRIVLASKGGLVGEDRGQGMQRVFDARPDALIRHCEASLRRLQTDVIDLYYLHRWDRTIPIEDVVGAMARLVQQGKVRALGLSEVSGVTLRRAHAVHPISAVQNEYSLWTRNPERSLLAVCRELGTALVAFSPLGRGYLSTRLRDVRSLASGDIRRTIPRFEPTVYAQNLKLLPAFEALAAAAGCTPAQLALAWVLAQGQELIALPGTTSVEHLRENLGAAGLQPAPALFQRAAAVFAPDRVQGERYSVASMTEIDTEAF